MHASTNPESGHQAELHGFEDPGARLRAARAAHSAAAGPGAGGPHPMPFQHHGLSELFDTSGRPDVYASIEPFEFVSASPETATCTVSVVSDATSNVLARIYGLLATLSLVPVTARSSKSTENLIRLQMNFKAVGESRIDLLCRKLLQLTETNSVVATNR